jgi:hypothetical protein
VLSYLRSPIPALIDQTLVKGCMLFFAPLERLARACLPYNDDRRAIIEIYVTENADIYISSYKTIKSIKRTMGSGPFYFMLKFFSNTSAGSGLENR